MLVKNESRIKFSQAMTTYRFPRQVLLTFKLRLQVRQCVQAQLSRQPKTSARCGLSSNCCAAHSKLQHTIVSVDVLGPASACQGAGLGTPPHQCQDNSARCPPDKGTSACQCYCTTLLSRTPAGWGKSNDASSPFWRRSLRIRTYQPGSDHDVEFCAGYRQSGGREAAHHRVPGGVAGRGAVAAARRLVRGSGGLLR